MFTYNKINNTWVIFSPSSKVSSLDHPHDSIDRVVHEATATITRYI